MTPQTPQELERAQYEADVRRLATLSDSEILTRAGGMGPAVIGRALYERASQIRQRTNNGLLGPALIDPDYDKKQKARRAAAAAASVDPPDPADAPVVDDDPWSHVTLSGAKQLAMRNEVSYAPRIRRVELIELLKRANVAPPAKPVEDEDDADEFDAAAALSVAEGDE